MDKELAKLEEWAVDLINNYEKQLLVTDPRSSEHKRIKRFSGELVANPEAYGELLEMGRSKGMTGKQLISAIRKIEQGLLDESSKGKIPSRKQILSDVIHHFYAQRTGGDTLRRLSQANRQEARAILRDSFGRWGNVPENLVSLFRGGHLKSDVLKGLEAEAMNPLGVTQAKQLDLPYAHTTTGKAVTGDIIGATTAEEAVAGMRPQFELQGKETQAAIEATRPLMDELDLISGSKYTPTMSAEELALRRSVLDANKDKVIKAFQKFYKPYIIGGGNVNYNAAGMGAITALASSPEAMGKIAQGDFKGAFKTVGTEMIIGEGVSQGLQFGLSKVSPQIVQAVAPALQSVSTVSAATTVPEVVARVATKGQKGATEVLSEAPRAAVAASLGPVSPTLGQTAANAPVDPKMNKQRLEAERKAEEARQRGGRLSFGFGGVKLTLPEFGLSEMLGVN